MPATAPARASAAALAAGLSYSLLGAHAAEPRSDQPAPPPVYLMPREGLFPLAVSPAASAPASREAPQARAPAQARPRPPLRPPGRPPARPPAAVPAAPPVPPAPAPVPAPAPAPAPAVPGPAPAAPAPAQPLPPAPTAPAQPAPSARPAPEPAAAPASPAARRFELTGEYRLAALAVRPTAESRGFGQQLNRLRLKLDAEVAPVLLHLENDFDLTTGNYLRTDEYRAARAGLDMPRTYWQARLHGGASRRAVLSSNVYRGWARWSGERTDITFGRQRIPLGTGLFWSALDMLNPPSPLRIESDEVLGVDALRVEHRLGELAKLEGVWAPDPEHRGRHRWVGVMRRHVHGADVTLTLGRYWEDRLVGVDVATQVGDSGLRLELAHTDPAVGRRFGKALFAWDHAWANTFSVTFEAFYSSQPAADRAAAAQRHPQLRFAQPEGSAYAGLTMGYDLTPLWRVSVVWLANLRDGSRMAYPSLAHSLSDNLSLLMGSQFFFGARGSEFGSAGDTHFVRMQYHF